MRIILTLTACICLLSATAQIKAGDAFPALSGENLNDAVVTFPPTNGKETVVLIAYTSAAQKASKVWVKELYSTFLDANNMTSGLYDVNTYYLYLFGGVKKAVMGKIKKRVKPETDEDLYDNVVIAMSTDGFYKEQLNFEDRDAPNVFLINEAGKIVWHGSGRYTSAKMDALQDAIGGE